MIVSGAGEVDGVLIPALFLLNFPEEELWRDTALMVGGYEMSSFLGAEGRSAV